MRIVYPGSEEYQMACRMVNRRVDAKPASVLFCSSVQDVQEAVAIAKRNQKTIRIRSGRHSYEGFSIGGENTYVIDVSDINGISIDKEKDMAVIGAGAQLYYDVYLPLWEKGRYTISGWILPNCRLRGLLAGGGFGFSGRLYGLSCDSIKALQIVPADNRVLNINQTHYRDLYWACCGGGNGNFGIITNYTVKLYPADNVYIYMIDWKWDDHLPNIVQAWFCMVSNTPKELMCFLRFTVTKQGPILSSFGQYYGDENDLKSILDQYFSAFQSVSLKIEPLSNVDAVRH